MPMARGHAFHGGPRPPENLHLNIHQGNPLCYFLVGPEMSFVYLVLVIKDQSRPSECAVSSRREATENCNASYRPNDGKVAESIHRAVLRLVGQDCSLAHSRSRTLSWTESTLYPQSTEDTARLPRWITYMCTDPFLRVHTCF